MRQQQKFTGQALLWMLSVTKFMQSQRQTNDAIIEAIQNPDEEVREYVH